MTVRFRKVFLKVVTLLCLAPATYAGMLDCDTASQSLARLQNEIQSAFKDEHRLALVFDDAAPLDTDTDTLGAWLGDGEPLESSEWPDSISCDGLQEEYQGALAELRDKLETVKRLRDKHWLHQPQVGRDALLSIWRSRQRLLAHSDILEPLITSEADGKLVNWLERRHQLHKDQRLTFFALLPSLTEQPSIARDRRWLEFWQQSLALSRDNLTLDDALLDGLDEESRAALRNHLHILTLDALVMSNVTNNVRAWLWNQSRQNFTEAMSELDINPWNLLALETRAFSNILQWLFVDASVDFRPEGSDALVRRLFYGFEYIVGLLSFVALGLIARKTRDLVTQDSSSVHRRKLRSRLSMQLWRMLAGAGSLLPWLVGLVGLELLEKGFRQNQLPLLMPFIPFGRLYILYGLMRLFGAWYLHRINERAGTFISPAQARSIRLQARRAAVFAMLPVLLHDLAELAIGPSLLLLYLRWLTAASVLLALSALLLPWRETFICALQSFLPEKIDPWVERIVTPGSMFLFGPVLSPLLLASMLVTFVHRGLIDLDWYRKIIARSFKLRSSGPEKSAEMESDHDAFQAYRSWFEDAAGDSEPPIIKIDLFSRIQDILTPWIENRSEENSLLLSGERGAGKSVALRALQQWLETEKSDINVCSIDVPPKTCSKAGVASLLANALADDTVETPASLVKTDEVRKPTVIILENAQNFFLRDVGSLEGWETVLAFTKARVKNIFWVVSINNQSWAYLSRVFGGDYQFSTVLRTSRWSQSEIRSLILSRHQQTGFTIRYDDILLSTRGPEAGSVRNAEQLYFSLLWDSCIGNPLLGLTLWLSSVTVTGKTVVVGLPAEVTSTSLEHLGDDLHFVYAALIIHENLTSEELVAATALSESTVRAALKSAFDTGFIKRSEDRRHRIVPLWYPAVTRLLTRKNLLHE